MAHKFPTETHPADAAWHGQGPTPAERWIPTHASINDDSTVRLVSEEPFIIENEAGDRWEATPSDWRPLSVLDDDPAAQLLATLVQHNVDSLAHTNDLIRHTLEDQIKSFAKAFLTLYNGIEAIPNMQRTVYLDRLLQHTGHMADEADRVLGNTGDSY